MTQPTQQIRMAAFDNLLTARRAVARVVGAGVPRVGVTLVSPESGASPNQVESHDPQAQGAGAVVGAAGGGALGALAAGASIVAGGGAPLLAAGVAVPIGAAAGVAGGLLGAMAARGAAPEETDLYEQALELDQVLVSVEIPAGGRLAPSEVARLLRLSGGHPVAA